MRRVVSPADLYTLFFNVVKIDTDEASVIASCIFGILKMKHFNR